MKPRTNRRVYMAQGRRVNLVLRVLEQWQVEPYGTLALLLACSKRSVQRYEREERELPPPIEQALRIIERQMMQERKRLIARDWNNTVRKARSERARVAMQRLLELPDAE
jgi:predicted transcriptional regulator